MNLCAASTKYLALCGQNNVYIASLMSDSDFVRLSFVNSRPAMDPKMKEKISAVCMNMSSDSKYLCASDSHKNVYLYQNCDSVDNGALGWKLLTCFTVEKRLMKVNFDCDTRNLIMIDKSGDVYASRLSTAEEIRNPKKILGHCSVILDAKLNRDNTEIFTSDRDEKIRISRFPHGFVINDYLLSHSEAVVSLYLTRNEKYLLSMDIDGIVKVWDLNSHSCVRSFNTLKHLNFEDLQKSDAEKGKSVDYQVVDMKVTELFDSIHFAIKISHYDAIPIFKVNGISNAFAVSLEDEVPDVKFQYWDMCWVSNTLYIVVPGLLQESKKVVLSEDGKISPSTEFLHAVTNLQQINEDLKEFALFSDSSVPLRKRGLDISNSTSERSRNVKVSRLEN